MSSQSSQRSGGGGLDEEDRPSHYVYRAKDGDDTWLEDAIENFLEITVTQAQREICRALHNNEKLLVVTANGLGKSYILAAITNVWLFTKPSSTVFATSGTEKKMKRTFCKPVESLHDDAPRDLPGEYKQQPPRIEFPGEPERYFQASSPQDAGELEGVHSGYSLAIIEEADKKDVDGEVMEAMDSLVTDQRDRTIAIANPPKDETNIVADMMEPSSEWETLQFSSFESHNVQVERGEVEGELIDGLATLWKIKQDWAKYHDREWPGAAEAAQTGTKGSPHYDPSLDGRWFRRRLGKIPPAGAAAWRPVDLPAVKAAFDRPVGEAPPHPDAVAIDVARKIDRTVMAGVHGLEASGYDPEIRIHYADQGKDHTKQEADLRTILDEWHPRDVPIAIDHMGSGEGLGDRLNMAYPDVHFFQNGGIAANETQYYDCWTEGLDMLGTFLADGGAFANTYLREELVATSRTITLSERHLASRGEDGADVIDSDSKDNIKDAIGRSPDFLDASLMAVWRATADPDSGEDSFLISY